MPRIVPISYKKLTRLVEIEGFTLVRESGDHMIFTKAGIIRPVVVPRYNAIPVFIIKNILRTAGISRDKYFELLEKV